jgi:hypothetical protein
MTVNLTVLNGRTVLFLGWIGSGGPAEAFAASYARLPQAEKANTAVRLAIEYIENTYAKPSWWNGLPQELRDGVVASIFMMSAPDMCQRRPDGLCLDGKIFATASVSREHGLTLCRKSPARGRGATDPAVRYGPIPG